MLVLIFRSCVGNAVPVYLSFLGKTEYPFISGFWDEIGTVTTGLLETHFVLVVVMFSRMWKIVDCLIYFLIQTKKMEQDPTRRKS
jgi:hypothetical protein